MYGWKRSSCDLAFKKDMVQLCRSFGTSKRFLKNVWEVLKSLVSWATADEDQRCVKAANTYYTAVEEFGESHFAENSPEWCDQPCAKAEGNPNELLIL